MVMRSILSTYFGIGVGKVIEKIKKSISIFEPIF